MFSIGQWLLDESIPLHTAAFRGEISKVRSLLNAKIDINIKDRAEFTALHKAAYSGQLDVVKLLISKGLMFMQELLKAVHLCTLLL